MYVLGFAMPSALFLQVQYPNLPQSVLAAAERMGGGKAKPALQLVGYAHEVEAAMKYAFGGAFVCEVGACLGALMQGTCQERRAELCLTITGTVGWWSKEQRTCTGKEQQHIWHPLPILLLWVLHAAVQHAATSHDLIYRMLALPRS
jgi:hypothetical protein